MRIPPVIRNFVVQAVRCKIKNHSAGLQPTVTGGMIFLLFNWSSIFRFKTSEARAEDRVTAMVEYVPKNLTSVADLTLQELDNNPNLVA